MRGMRSGRLRVRGQWRRRLRKARRAGVVMVALAMLPMLMGASSATGQAPMPTLAEIRADVVRLMDWVTGRTPPTSAVPRQQAGKAPGRQRQVPAAVTRAVARARGHVPGKGPGQLPAYAFPAAKVKRHVTGLADPGGPASFSRATSHLVPSGSTATTSLYRNADGSYTRLESPTAVGAGSGTLTFSGLSRARVKKGTHVTSASLRVRETWTGRCPVSAAVNVSDASGQRVGGWVGKPPAAACGTRARGGWVTVPVSAAELREIGSGAGVRLTVTATPAAASPATPAVSRPSAAPAASVFAGSRAV